MLTHRGGRGCAVAAWSGAWTAGCGGRSQRTGAGTSRRGRRPSTFHVKRAPGRATSRRGAVGGPRASPDAGEMQGQRRFLRARRARQPQIPSRLAPPLPLAARLGAGGLAPLVPARRDSIASTRPPRRNVDEGPHAAARRHPRNPGRRWTAPSASGIGSCAFVPARGRKWAPNFVLEISLAGGSPRPVAGGVTATRRARTRARPVGCAGPSAGSMRWSLNPYPPPVAGVERRRPNSTGPLTWPSRRRRLWVELRVRAGLPSRLLRLRVPAA